MISKKKYNEEYNNAELKKAYLKKSLVVDENKINISSFIHITLSIDNNCFYQALVSMTSIMENCNKNKTIVCFYILFEGNVAESNLEKLESIITNYKENAELHLYNMSDAFYSLKWYRKKTPTFYRLLLPYLLEFLDRIIYIDTDVLAFDDLSEMYNLHFNNNYILASRDHKWLGKEVKKLGINNDKYICAGIILFNLKKIRRENKSKLTVQFLLAKTKYIRYYDQTVINYIFYPYIGRLPYKYGIFNYLNEKDLKKVYKPYNLSKESMHELISAHKKPSLVHFVRCSPKLWYKRSKRKITRKPCEDTKIWYNYAKKTNYYKEICNKFTKNKGLKSNIKKLKTD